MSLNDKVGAMETKYNIMNNIVSDILHRIDNNEKTINDLNELSKENQKYIKNQDIYSRRSNIEFYNIPESILQNDLEAYIVKMLNSAKIKVQSYDIVAVHRLGKFVSGRKRNVIVRFINRKNTYKCFGLGKKLANIAEYKNKKIYTIENLCPTNKKIFNALYKLKKQNIIYSVWTKNGRIFYQENEDYNDFVEAESLEEIDYLFRETDNSQDTANQTNIQFFY